MTIKQAEVIVKNFYNIDIPEEKDIFRFIEASEFLIEETKNPRIMLELGGYYYGEKKYDLALKYYEMAASYDYEDAYECLGYIWYYGRTGEVDYERAFYYFSKMMEKGNPVATYKVADMYKNGYFVEKNEEKYIEIIEGLYKKSKVWNNAFDPIPEVCTRLAKIRTKQGEVKEAVDLYLYAKRVLSVRIEYNPFFGNLNIMKWLIEDLYKLIDFDEEDFDLFDLYFVLRENHKITFEYDGVIHEIISENENGENHVCYDGKWYRTIDDFFSKAELDGGLLTSLHSEIYDFEVVK